MNKSSARRILAKIATKQKKDSIEVVAREKLGFLFHADRQNAFLAKIAARAAEGLVVSPQEESHWIECARCILDPSQRGRVYETHEGGISIWQAPFEEWSEPHPFTNSLGEDDEWAQEWERIITPWAPATHLRETTYILEIDPAAPRKLIEKALFEWLAKFRKEHATSARKRAPERSVAEYHFCVEALTRSGFSMDTIDRFLRRHELGLTPTAQNDARESRRHTKKLCGLIRRQVSSMSVGPLSQYGPRFAEYERMSNIPEGRAAAAVRRMTEK